MDGKISKYKMTKFRGLHFQNYFESKTNSESVLLKCSKYHETRCKCFRVIPSNSGLFHNAHFFDARFFSSFIFLFLPTSVSHTFYYFVAVFSRIQSAFCSKIVNVGTQYRNESKTEYAQITHQSKNGNTSYSTFRTVMAENTHSKLVSEIQLFPENFSKFRNENAFSL